MVIKVAVIGAGVIGLSAAVLVQERLAGVHVKIYTEATTPSTTGDVAPGLWKPSAVDSPSMLKWGKATYDYLFSLVRHPDQNKIGITLLNGFSLDSPETGEETPSWVDIPDGMRRMSNKEVALFPPATGGWAFVAPICEGRRFNSWLMDKFLANGGEIINRKVNRLSELTEENFACLINCSGLGAKALIGDDEVFPIRGQVRRVRAPWITWFVSGVTETGSNYIIPNSDSVVLGGTEQKNDWSTDVRSSDVQHIVDGTKKLVPSLEHAEVVCDQVGLRPGRTKTRLELETVEVDGKAVKVIHNYGHGGSGYTLFYGCALEVVNILADVIKT